LRLYKEELEEEGYVIVTASNGQEAIERFEQEDPDLVTLDILLPDIDGIKLLRQMKKRSRDCRLSCQQHMITGMICCLGI